MPYTSHISPPIPAPYPTSTFRSPLAQVVGNASFYQFQLIKRFYQHDLLYRLQYTIWSRWWIFCTNRFFAEDLIDRYIRKTSDSKSIDEELPFDWPPYIKPATGSFYCILWHKNGGRFIGHHKKIKKLTHFTWQTHLLSLFVWHLFQVLMRQVQMYHRLSL